MNSNPKCHGQMLEYAGMGGCGECGKVTTCETASKAKETKAGLTKTQLTIMIHLLKIAETEFTYHGCNDYTLENTPENFKFVEDAESKDYWPPNKPNISEDGKMIHTFDATLMGHCRDLLKQLLE